MHLYVVFWENLVSLHVSPCSSLELSAHLDFLGSAIVMATLGLNVSEPLQLLHHQQPGTCGALWDVCVRWSGWYVYISGEWCVFLSVCKNRTYTSLDVWKGFL